MTPQGEPTASALQALAGDGTLTGYSPLRMASLDNTITVHAVFARQ